MKKRTLAIAMVAVLIGAVVLVTAAPALAAKFTLGVWTGKGIVGNVTPATNVNFSLHHSLGYEDSMKLAWGRDRFELTQLTFVEVMDDPSIVPEPPATVDTMHGIGVGSYNGVVGYQVDFVFKDEGKPGINDWAWVKITAPDGTTVLEVSGFLLKGNIRAG